MERTIQVVQPMKLAERKLLRVAAYARVSCDKDAMKHLGLTAYDAEAVRSRIVQIEAMPENILIFHLTDGTTGEVKWSFPSRSESWTEEMRQKAAEQTRRHYAKTSD